MSSQNLSNTTNGSDLDFLMETLLQNRFKITSLLAKQGANSQVYSGVDFQNGNEVIIKVNSVKNLVQINEQGFLIVG